MATGRLFLAIVFGVFAFSDSFAPHNKFRFDSTTKKTRHPPAAFVEKIAFAPPGKFRLDYTTKKTHPTFPDIFDEKIDQRPRPAALPKTSTLRVIEQSSTTAENLAETTTTDSTYEFLYVSKQVLSAQIIQLQMTRLFCYCCIFCRM